MQTITQRLIHTLFLSLTLIATNPLWAGSVDYNYDDLGRLQSMVFDNGAQIEYSYDAVGNRHTKVTSGANVVNQAISSGALSGSSSAVNEAAEVNSLTDSSIEIIVDNISSGRNRAHEK